MRKSIKFPSRPSPPSRVLEWLENAIPTLIAIVFIVIAIAIAGVVDVYRWSKYREITGSQMSFWDWSITNPQVVESPKKESK